MRRLTFILFVVASLAACSKSRDLDKLTADEKARLNPCVVKLEGKPRYVDTTRTALEVSYRDSKGEVSKKTLTVDRNNGFDGSFAYGQFVPYGCAILSNGTDGFTLYLNERD